MLLRKAYNQVLERSLARRAPVPEQLVRRRGLEAERNVQSASAVDTVARHKRVQQRGRHGVLTPLGGGAGGAAGGVRQQALCRGQRLQDRSVCAVLDDCAVIDVRPQRERQPEVGHGALGGHTRRGAERARRIVVVECHPPRQAGVEERLCAQRPGTRAPPNGPVGQWQALWERATNWLSVRVGGVATEQHPAVRHPATCARERVRAIQLLHRIGCEEFQAGHVGWHHARKRARRRAAVRRAAVGMPQEPRERRACGTGHGGRGSSHGCILRHHHHHQQQQRRRRQQQHACFPHRCPCHASALAARCHGSTSCFGVPSSRRPV
mmetsp:Transcript_18539/g.55346  ORF Transcript_18539/g.55346 Transcript_18539/m.55346 type:complete len:323 (+) Transcript_18539:853-1821(+)